MHALSYKTRINVTVEISPRIFCFYALLNIGGYDPESDIVHPVRKCIRDFLIKTIPESVHGKINTFMTSKEVRQEYWYPLRTWVLCHGQPPRFSALSKQWEKTLQNDNAIEFQGLLNLLWNRYEVSSQWEKLKFYYDTTKDRVFDNAHYALNEALSYLRIDKEQSSLNEFVVVPNFLDEPNRGLGPRIDRTAYAILGPSVMPEDSFPVSRIEHEFLHSIINPITAEIFKDVHGRSLSKIREGLINGIVLRVNSNNKDYVKRKRKALREKGFKIEKILHLLISFEESRMDIKSFLSDNTQKIKEACLF